MKITKVKAMMAPPASSSSRQPFRKATSSVFFFFFFSPILDGSIHLHLLLLLALFLLLLPGAQLVAAQATCDGSSGSGTGVVSLTGQPLGAARFEMSAGCKGITLDGCSADEVIFGGLSDVSVIIKNLSCSESTTSAACVYFSSAVDGGGVVIDGVSRTISGDAAEGNSDVVWFRSAMTGVSGISIKNIVLTLNLTSAHQVIETNIYLVRVSSTVAGDSSAGSSLIVSDCLVAPGSTIDARAAVRLTGVHMALAVSGFESVEVSRMRIEKVALTSADKHAELYLVLAQRGITLTGTPNSAIIFRDNSMRSSSAVVTNKERNYAKILLFHGPFQSGKNIAGLSSLIVDGADLRDCTVSATSGEMARFAVLLFFPASPLSMLYGGRISINDAWLGGEMTYSSPDVDTYGAKILQLHDASGVKEISATNCLIDMSKNNGIQASESNTNAIARVLNFDSPLSGLTSITATNCSIRGKYSSAASNVHLHVLYAASTLSAGTVSITDSEVATTAPVIDDGPVEFVGAVSNSNIIIKNLGCGDAASPSSICVRFAATVMGGSVDLNGLRRTVSGSAAGVYFAVLFNRDVSGVSGIAVKGIVLTLDSLSTAGGTDVWLLYALSTVAGDSSAGSVFNVSDCEITSGSSVTTSSGSGSLMLLRADRAISGFETVGSSGNKIEGLMVSVTRFAEVYAFSAYGGITLTGTANSAIIMRRNSLKGSSAVSTGKGAARIILFNGPFENGKNIAGVSNIIIDGADMRDCTVTAASGVWATQYARLMVLYLHSSPTLTLVNDGKISINNAWIGGEMTYSVTHAEGYGAKILQLFSSSTTGIKEISATNCLIDMNKNNGIQASGASVAAIARVLDLDKALSGLTSIAASNCSIRGNFSSVSSTVDLHVLRAGSTLNAGTVSVTDSEVATTAPVIENGPLQFLGAVSSSNIIIKNLGCGDAASPSSICVYFASTINGGSIDINGMTRTVSGSASGVYSMVKFNGAVSGVSGIAVKGIVLTLDSLSTAGGSYVYGVYAPSTIAGDSSAGSAFNFSDCTVTAGSSITTSRGRARLWFVYTTNFVSGFETLEASGNRMAGVALSGSPIAALTVWHPRGGLTLTGTADAAIIMCSNSVRGSSVVSTSSGYAQIVLFAGPGESGKNIAGVSSIIVDGADMRDCTVTAAAGQWGRLMVLYFPLNPPLTLVNNGKISINNAWIGGEMTYGAADNVEGYGAKILNLVSSSTTGIKEISATNCLIDMNKNSGMQASGTDVAVTAEVLDLRPALSGPTSITASNCSIRGKYNSAAFHIGLYMLYVAKPLSAGTVSVINSEVATAAPVIDYGPVRFVEAVSNSNIIIKNLGCGDASFPLSVCVFFISTITGGSITIKGMTRTISGSAAGFYKMVNFQKEVSGVSGISIKGIVLTLSSLSTTSNTYVYLVYAASPIAADSSAGSAFNFSDSTVTAGSSITTSSGVARIFFFDTVGLVSGFDVLEVSGNKLEGVSVAAPKSFLTLIFPVGGITLTGTADAAIIMRGNSMRGTSAVSTGSGWAQIVLFHGPNLIGNNIAGVSSIIVDGADMRDCTATAAAGQWARLFVLHFPLNPTLALVSDGKISINNAWIGGEMTYSKADSTNGYGAKILNLVISSTTGIKEISATNCLIDMSKNNGMQASGASVVAIARMLDLNVALSGLTSIAASNCSICGKYNSAAGTATVGIFFAAQKLESVRTVEFVNNRIADAHVVGQRGARLSMFHATTYILADYSAGDGSFRFVGNVISTSAVVRAAEQGSAACAMLDGNGVSQFAVWEFLNNTVAANVSTGDPSGGTATVRMLSNEEGTIQLTSKTPVFTIRDCSMRGASVRGGAAGAQIVGIFILKWFLFPAAVVVDGIDMRDLTAVVPDGVLLVHGFSAQQYFYFGSNRDISLSIRRVHVRGSFVYHSNSSAQPGCGVRVAFFQRFRTYNSISAPTKVPVTIDNCSIACAGACEVTAPAAAGAAATSTVLNLYLLQVEREYDLSVVPKLNRDSDVYLDPVVVSNSTVDSGSFQLPSGRSQVFVELARLGPCRGLAGGALVPSQPVGATAIGAPVAETLHLINNTIRGKYEIAGGSLDVAFFILDRPFHFLRRVLVRGNVIETTFHVGGGGNSNDGRGHGRVSGLLVDDPSFPGGSFIESITLRGNRVAAHDAHAPRRLDLLLLNVLSLEHGNFSAAHLAAQDNAVSAAGLSNQCCWPRIGVFWSSAAYRRGFMDDGSTTVSFTGNVISGVDFKSSTEALLTVAHINTNGQRSLTLAGNLVIYGSNSTIGSGSQKSLSILRSEAAPSNGNGTFSSPAAADIKVTISGNSIVSYFVEQPPPYHPIFIKNYLVLFGCFSNAQGGGESSRCRPRGEFTITDNVVSRASPAADVVANAPMTYVLIIEDLVFPPAGALQLHFARNRFDVLGDSLPPRAYQLLPSLAPPAASRDPLGNDSPAAILHANIDTAKQPFTSSTLQNVRWVFHCNLWRPIINREFRLMWYKDVVRLPAPMPRYSERDDGEGTAAVPVHLPPGVPPPVWPPAECHSISETVSDNATVSRTVSESASQLPTRSASLTETQMLSLSDTKQQPLPKAYDRGFAMGSMTTEQVVALQITAGMVNPGSVALIYKVIGISSMSSCGEKPEFGTPDPSTVALPLTHNPVGLELGEGPLYLRAARGAVVGNVIIISFGFIVLLIFYSWVYQRWIAQPPDDEEAEEEEEDDQNKTKNAADNGDNKKKNSNSDGVAAVNIEEEEEEEEDTNSNSSSNNKTKKKENKEEEKQSKKPAVSFKRATAEKEMPGKVYLILQVLAPPIATIVGGVLWSPALQSSIDGSAVFLIGALGGVYLLAMPVGFVFLTWHCWRQGAAAELAGKAKDAAEEKRKAEEGEQEAELQAELLAAVEASRPKNKRSAERTLQRLRAQAEEKKKQQEEEEAAANTDPDGYDEFSILVVPDSYLRYCDKSWRESLPFYKRWWKWFMLKQFVWSETDTCIRYGAWIGLFSLPAFGIMDSLTVQVISFLSGFAERACQSRSCCTASLYTSVIFACLHFILLVYLSYCRGPKRVSLLISRFDLIFSTIASFATVGAGALAIISFEKIPLPGGGVFVDWYMQACDALSFIGTFVNGFDIVAPVLDEIYQSCRNKRQGKKKKKTKKKLIRDETTGVEREIEVTDSDEEEDRTVSRGAAADEEELKEFVTEGEKKRRAAVEERKRKEREARRGVLSSDGTRRISLRMAGALAHIRSREQQQQQQQQNVGGGNDDDDDDGDAPLLGRFHDQMLVAQQSSNSNVFSPRAVDSAAAAAASPLSFRGSGAVAALATTSKTASNNNNQQQQQQQQYHPPQHQHLRLLQMQQQNRQQQPASNRILPAVNGTPSSTAVQQPPAAAAAEGTATPRATSASGSKRKRPAPVHVANPTELGGALEELLSPKPSSKNKKKEENKSSITPEVNPFKDATL